jgi:threonine/homoserine/homoserine lactone efflux protein
MTFIIGTLLGLSTLLFIGPVFFYLVKSSLEDGFKAGVYVSLGVLVGDIICALLAIYGFSDSFTAPENLRWIALIGGLVLFVFGLQYLIKPSIKETSTTPISGKKSSVYFIKGFMINFLNPFVFGVWFGFYSLTKSKLVDENLVVISLCITLVVILITDIMKAYYAQKLKLLLQERMLKVIFRIIGVVMIGFGIRLALVFFK